MSWFKDKHSATGWISAAQYFIAVCARGGHLVGYGFVFNNKKDEVL